MFLVSTIAEGQAQGTIKEVYDIFQGSAPDPLRLFSASPGMFEQQAGMIKYFMGHKALSFPLLTAIRFISSDECGHEFCLDFNRQLLMRAGMSPEDIEAMKADPSTAPLEDREQSMLVFVAKALRAPKSVSQADVDSLRAEGWSDSDIFDALAHGANMLASAAVFNALKK